ncbi:hypothetical protein [Nocardia mikamii]|uniref:hypothetical protein n=1 Tax=Nocardia mikamii TaxID=508464 RepID=UPI0012F49768|nr:hypothetical protein [Nocardia mikamii]
MMKTLPSGNVSQSTAANRSTSFYGEAEAADSGVDVVGHAIVRRWVSPVGSVIRPLIDRAAMACGDVGDPNDRQRRVRGEPAAPGVKQDGWKIVTDGAVLRFLIREPT